MTVAATLFSWEGTPTDGHKRAIGTVRVAADGRAMWDEALDPYMNPMPRDPRTGLPLDPADGYAFVQAMPFVFRAAPYTWAEPGEPHTPPRPDVRRPAHRRL